VSGIFYAVLIGALGSSGLTGLFFAFVRRAAERRLEAAEEKRRRLEQINEEIAYSKTEWYDAVFELQSQLYRKMRGKEVGFELDDAYKSLVCAHRNVKGLYLKKSRMLKGE